MFQLNSALDILEVVSELNKLLRRPEIPMMSVLRFLSFIALLLQAFWCMCVFCCACVFPAVCVFVK